jgi:hypothetical protein
MNQPAKYRKRPVVIDAIRWTGENTAAVRAFLGNDFGGVDYTVTGEWVALYVATLEDGTVGVTVKHVADVGDWIIRGVQGEHYPCKPAIFEATYEPADV